MISLAYRFVALSLMLAEANFFASKVGLKTDQPLGESDLRSGGHLGPPRTNDFSGSLYTDACVFGFGWGHLANFYRRDFRPTSDAAAKEQNARLSKLSSLIDTNGAYQLATNLLTTIGVDVAALGSRYVLNINQWRYRPEGLGQNPVLLPVYQVEWRGWPFPAQNRRREMAVVTVTILGATKELLEYHLLDDSLCVRPRINIPDPKELLSIPDAEFRAFDALKRSKLLSSYETESVATDSGGPKLVR